MLLGEGKERPEIGMHRDQRPGDRQRKDEPCGERHRRLAQPQKQDRRSGIGQIEEEFAGQRPGEAEAMIVEQPLMDDLVDPGLGQREGVEDVVSNVAGTPFDQPMGDEGIEPADHQEEQV